MMRCTMSVYPHILVPGEGRQHPVSRDNEVAARSCREYCILHSKGIVIVEFLLTACNPDLIIFYEKDRKHEEIRTMHKAFAA